VAETKPAPTYGVTESDFGDQYCYLGSDEVLWDWANAPIDVSFGNESAVHIPLPEGYVVTGGQGSQPTRVFNATEGLPDGVEDLSDARTTVLVTVGSAMEDKIQVLTRSMESVEPKEFRTAGLPEDRILETVAY
jgi:hypothetical protein